MTRCKYFDCGWCCAPIDVVTSASSCGSCIYPEHCPYLKTEMSETHDLRNQWYDEPVQYETPMTKNEEEIEKVKAQIKVLQSKLSFLEEMENHKTPCEEAYKRVYGNYPDTNIGTGFSYVYWDVFQKAYEQAQKDYKVGECQEPVKKKSLYQFLAEWKYGIEEGDIIPQFDNDEFSVLDWSQIFIEYLYECGDIISEDKDEIVIKLKQTQLEIPND